MIIQGVVFSSTFKEEYGGKAERAKDTGIRPLKFEETLQYVIP